MAKKRKKSSSGRVTAGKPVSVRTLTTTRERGMRICANYQSEGSAKRKVAELKKKGYNARYTEIMGNYEVWVSAKYFSDHPKARKYLD